MLLGKSFFGVFYGSIIIPAILSKIITVRDGHPFIHFIDIQNNRLESCILEFLDEKISLYPNEINSVENPIKEKIDVFENSACGYKFNQFNEDDPKMFNLTAIVKGNSTPLKHDLYIIFSEKSFLQNISVFTNNGITLDIRECKVADMKRCYLYSPSGQLVDSGTSSCTHRITVMKHYIGDWKCEVSLDGDLMPLTFYINLSIYRQPKIESWYRKENGKGIVGCKYADRIDNGFLEACSMESPQKKMLYLTEYSATERYTSFKTNFTENICEFEFDLPAKQNETGTWACHLGSGMVKRRGFINVEYATDYPKYQKIFTPLTTMDGVQVKCDVPYSAVTAFALDPIGQVFYKASYNDSQDGKLHFKIRENFTEDIFGNWECHFGKPNSSEDDIIIVSIERIDQVASKYTHINVRNKEEEEELVILFKIRGPIWYCIIEDPQGHFYHIEENTKSSTVEYYGSGFDDGECGIKVKQVSATLEGTWKCMTNFIEKSEGFNQIYGETYIDITAEKQEMFTKSSAIPYLIAIMCLVVVTTAVVVLVKFRKEKKKEHESPPNSLGSANSGESFVVRQY